MKTALSTKAPPALAPQTLLWMGVFTGGSAVTDTLHTPQGHCLLSLTRSLLPQGCTLPRPPAPVDFSSAVPLGKHGLSARKPWPASSIALLSICSPAPEVSRGHFSSTFPHAANSRMTGLCVAPWLGAWHAVGSCKSLTE